MPQAPQDGEQDLSSEIVDRTVAVMYSSNGDDGGLLAVWHVDTGADPSLARQCGAWVLRAGRDSMELRHLTQRRPVLAAGAALRAAREAEIAASGIVDPAGTVRRVRGEIAALQRNFDRSQAKGGTSHVAPAWPVIPDWPVPEQQPAKPGRAGLDSLGGTDADDVAAATLQRAQWLARLADAWQAVETQRLQRKSLRASGGSEKRSLPLVFVDAGAEWEPDIPPGQKGAEQEEQGEQADPGRLGRDRPEQ